MEILIAALPILGLVPCGFLHVAFAGLTRLCRLGRAAAAAVRDLLGGDIGPTPLGGAHA